MLALLLGGAVVGGASPDGAAGRRVEVRADGRVLAAAALLLEDPEHGPLLRLADLDHRLPHHLPKAAEVERDGHWFLPLRALGGVARLDRGRGVVTFADPPAWAGVEPGAGPPSARHRPALPLAAPVPVVLRAAPPRPRPAVSPDAFLFLGTGEKPPLTRAPELDLAPAALPPERPPPVRRRDPLEQPLLPDEEWQEWLFEVTLNGALVSPGALVLRGPEGEIALRVLDLRAWRVRLDPDTFISVNGEQFVPLAALPGAALGIDEGALALDLVLPPGAFEATRIERGRLSTLEPRAGRGGFVDYDVLFLAGDGVRARLDALLEAGVFDQVGVLVGNFRLGDLTDGDEGREVVRLETTFIRDLPARRASVHLGDSITAGGALGRPVRFAGLQVSTNFATDPGFITFPLPSIGGLAEQAGVAEVFLDNTRRVQEEIPPGPFEIDNLPVVTGAGEVQVRVTDLLGREQLITQDYYVSPRLLRAGLSDFSYALGFEREDFNRESFGYGDPFGVATHRYGFTNGLSGEGRAELGLERQAAGLGGSVLLGGFGLLSGGLGGSHDRDAGTGFAGFLDYEYVSSRFSFGLRSSYTDPDFRQLGLDDPPDRRTDQVSLGVGLHPFGRLGLLFVNSEARERSDRQALSASYSLPLGPGTLLVNALRTLSPEHELAVAASYTLPLDGLHTATAGGSWREGASRGGVQLRRGRGASDLGLSYRVQGEAGDDLERVDGSVRYDASLMSGQLDLAHARGDTRARANLTGSVAHVDGRTGLTRRLGRAFGMVALPGHPDVKVYLENREVGTTDEDGFLLLPRLNPYQANRVRIRPEDLPLTAELDGEERLAVPFERAGLRIDFDVATSRTALLTLTGPDGAPLPAGLELVDAGGAASAQVADQGLAYVRSTALGGITLRSVPGQPAFTCLLPPLPDEPLAELGSVRCE
ncbi:MAG TPA: fimbria/pilus outer membrane usher protein [Geminicoccaceae bacterium]